MSKIEALEWVVGTASVATGFVVGVVTYEHIGWLCVPVGIGVALGMAIAGGATTGLIQRWRNHRKIRREADLIWEEYNQWGSHD